MSDIDNLLADMRRKYQHAVEDGSFLHGEGLGKSILEGWIPVVEKTVSEIETLRAEARRLKDELALLQSMM